MLIKGRILLRVSENVITFKKQTKLDELKRLFEEGKLMTIIDYPDFLIDYNTDSIYQFPLH